MASHASAVGGRPCRVPVPVKSGWLRGRWPRNAARGEDWRAVVSGDAAASLCRGMVVCFDAASISAADGRNRAARALADAPFLPLAAAPPPTPPPLFQRPLGVRRPLRFQRTLLLPPLAAASPDRRASHFQQLLRLQRPRSLQRLRCTSCG